MLDIRLLSPLLFHVFSYRRAGVHIEVVCNPETEENLQTSTTGASVRVLKRAKSGVKIHALEPILLMELLLWVFSLIFY